MANSKISALPSGSAPTGAEQLAVVQTGITKRITITALFGAYNSQWPIASGGTGAATALLARFNLDTGITVLTNSGSNVPTDASAAGNVFYVTVGANWTLGIPTNLKAGGRYTWFIDQGSGSFTLTPNAVFRVPGGGLTFSSGAGKIDKLECVVVSATGPLMYCTIDKDIKS